MDVDDSVVVHVAALGRPLLVGDLDGVDGDRLEAVLVNVHVVEERRTLDGEAGIDVLVEVVDVDVDGCEELDIVKDNLIFVFKAELGSRYLRDGDVAKGDTSYLKIQDSPANS